MSLEIKIPAVGESISEVTISQWVKKEGDQVEMDEVIAELESDKATFELNAEGSGVLHTTAEEGATVEVGEVIGNIDTESVGQSQPKETKESTSQESTAQESAPSSQPAPADPGEGGKKTGDIVEMNIPAVGESITEVTISQWLKEDGEMVEQDEVIAEIESDKATFELTAQVPGKLSIKVEAGTSVEVGTLACTIEEMEGAAQPATKQPAGEDKTSESGNGQQATVSPEESYAAHHASPAAAKILAEKGIEPKEVKGTGKDGRITKEDAEKATPKTGDGQAKTEPEKQPAAPKEEQAKETVTPGAKYETGEENRRQRREKMSSLRKTVSKRLVSVKNETAMLTTFNEVNMKPVMDIRKKYKEAFKEKFDVNLGFMSFFTKAACFALQEWPAVNAMIDGDEIIYNDYCDISIAVSSPKGLVVPVIRNAESMNFEQIEKEVVKLAKKARDNKLSIDEMSGGTFTITNGGIFGSMLSTPIINAPQSAILGMHNIVERAVVENGEIVIRPMMYLALSYDHRIIDGREAVSSLVRIKELIEDPTRLLLGV